MQLTTRIGLAGVLVAALWCPRGIARERRPPGPAGLVGFSGEVRGDINAEEKIEIHAPGRVIGNISAPTVTIDEGVIFEGHCQMENRRDKMEKKVAIFPQV